MKSKSMWILVEIRSGIPLSAKPFFKKSWRRLRKIKLRKRLNLENDETPIFKVKISSEENNDTSNYRHKLFHQISR